MSWTVHNKGCSSKFRSEHSAVLLLCLLRNLLEQSILMIWQQQKKISLSSLWKLQTFCIIIFCFKRICKTFPLRFDSFSPRLDKLKPKKGNWNKNEAIKCKTYFHARFYWWFSYCISSWFYWCKLMQIESLMHMYVDIPDMYVVKEG